MEKHRLLAISQVLMLGCVLAVVVIFFSVDGNGGFLGLEEITSLLVWGVIFSIGFASAGYVCTQGGRWRKVSLLLIMICLLLLALTFAPLIMVLLHVHS
jgi:hypothetical protein